MLIKSLPSVSETELKIFSRGAISYSPRAIRHSLLLTSSLVEDNTIPKDPRDGARKLDNLHVVASDSEVGTWDLSC